MNDRRKISSRAHSQKPRHCATSDQMPQGRSLLGVILPELFFGNLALFVVRPVFVARKPSKYLRPLERPVHIGISTNIWGALKPSWMCSFDVVDVGSRVD